jgi:indolepyruvate ferredoxin oxidoreductase beta subunit
MNAAIEKNQQNLNGRVRNENSRLKILVVGVGGQGALTATRFLGDAALLSGFEVMVSQLHGMSQRGGSVECSCIIGPGQSSFVGNSEADVVLGLEPLEALRALPKMSPHTKVVVNLGRIVPFHLAIQGLSYPAIEKTLEEIRQTAPQLFTVDGPALIQKVGVPRTLNVIMLGALAGLGMLPFSQNALWQAIEKRCPPRFLEANQQAFKLGIQSVEQGA